MKQDQQPCAPDYALREQTTIYTVGGAKIIELTPDGNANCGYVGTISPSAARSLSLALKAYLDDVDDGNVTVS